ncbi:50S ribosomal protein L10 [Candidatus Parcubacteria bacterium]|nr:MAG: 50S ribosomal protein L10 [Candidatus Parcubacteria bacterium]
MPITRAKKQQILEELSHILEESPTIAFVHFKGIPVAQERAMRRALREAGVRLRVAKKRLIARVLAERQFSGEMPSLEREVAIAFGGDEIAPAREIAKAAKALQTGELTLVGAVFEARYLSAQEAQALAAIPSRQELLAQLAFVLKSPIQRVAIALSEVAKQKA